MVDLVKTTVATAGSPGPSSSEASLAQQHAEQETEAGATAKTQKRVRFDASPEICIFDASSDDRRPMLWSDDARYCAMYGSQETKNTMLDAMLAYRSNQRHDPHKGIVSEHRMRSIDHNLCSSDDCVQCVFFTRFITFRSECDRMPPPAPAWVLTTHDFKLVGRHLLQELHRLDSLAEQNQAQEQTHTSNRVNRFSSERESTHSSTKEGSEEENKRQNDFNQWW